MKRGLVKMAKGYNLSEEGKQARIKKFEIEANQNIWNAYENGQLEAGRNISSLRQYKPAVLAIEKMYNVGIDSLTADQIDSFIKSNVIKNTSNIRGFLITCINEEIITPTKDVIAYLIPVEYKTLVKLLLG